MDERFIASKKDIDAIFFGCPQEFTVLKSSPAFISDGENFMCAQVRSQALRKIFVEQHLHG